MASSIASLFGPSAEEIVYAQQEAGKQRQQQQLQNTLAAYQDPMARQFYQSGYNIASGAGNIAGALFGDTPMADPRLAKSIQSRQIMADVGVEDLNDPRQLATLAQRFSEASMPEAALYFKDRQNALETQQRDYNLELAKATAKGAMKFTDLIAFRKDVKDSLKDAKTTLNSVRTGFKLYKEGKTKSNKQAINVLNREIANISKDSGIGVSEIANIVSGGSIPERLANTWSQIVDGVPSAGNLQEKLEILQLLERNSVDRYNKQVNTLKEVFSGNINQKELDASLNLETVSSFAREENLNTEIEITDEDINTFLGTP